MARTINNNYTESTNGYPIQFVEIQPDSNPKNTLYLNTSYRPLDYNGNTYYPAAGVLSLTAVEETKDVKTNEVTIQLTGLPNTIIPVLKEYDGIGGIVTIYQGWMDDQDESLTNENPYTGQFLKWKGVIYSHSVEEENQELGQVKINLECKNILGTILGSTHGRFTSDSSFKRTSNNDRSMEFVASMSTFNPKFGKE